MAEPPSFVGLNFAIFSKRCADPRWQPEIARHAADAQQLAVRIAADYWTMEYESDIGLVVLRDLPAAMREDVWKIAGTPAFDPIADELLRNPKQVVAMLKAACKYLRNIHAVLAESTSSGSESAEVRRGRKQRRARAIDIE